MKHAASYSTQTLSLCPECLRRLPAERVRQGDVVSLVKTCPEHGSFRTPIWRGEPGFDSWLRPKTPSAPLRAFHAVRDGCPYDCGLCPEHGQHTCTALLEVTQRCNLGCAVCFARAGEAAGVQDDPTPAQVGFWYDRVLEASGPCNIQLSGGEPTLRDDLPDLVAMGRGKGFDFIQLNTNGLRLAQDPDFGLALREAGLASVFLQFDGTDDTVYVCLRGRPLLDLKRRAVERCGELGLGVVLVPTVVPGVNDRQLGAILDFALQAGPHVRGVHFQPVSYFGRYPATPDDRGRLTLPELMRGLEQQTAGLVRARHCAPPGCEHALCSFHARYRCTAAGGLEVLQGRSSGGCCPQNAPEPLVAAEGARKSKTYTAMQWAGVSRSESSETGGDFDRFLQELRPALFSVSAMAFQDAWTLDLERLQGCCIHCVAPDGRLVPFCAYNLTARDGTPLYRGRS